MTNNEDAEVKMYGLMGNYFIQNTNKFSGFTRLTSEISTFSDNRLKLDVLSKQQAMVTTGMTVDKALAFADLGVLLVNTCSKAIIWARDTSNMTLAAVFAVTKGSYSKQTHSKKLAQANNIVTALTANTAALAGYSVKDTDILAISNGISACGGHMVAPGAVANSKKTATKAIKDMLKAISNSLDIIESLISGEFSVSDPYLVDEFDNNRRIDLNGVRHTGISATINDAATGKAIENATISIDALKKTATSGITGLAEIKPMKSGIYHINIGAEGYTAQTQDITVARGKVVELAVVLIKQPTV